MSPTNADILAAVLLLVAVVGAALYANILLGRSGRNRNGRVEILIAAGGLVMLALLARDLAAPETLLYCGAAGALLAVLIVNQWRWHMKTRGSRL